MAKDKQSNKTPSAPKQSSGRPQKGSLWAHRIPAAQRSAKKLAAIFRMTDAKIARITGLRAARPQAEIDRSEAVSHAPTWTPRHEPGYNAKAKREAKKRTYKARASGLAAVVTGRFSSADRHTSQVPKAGRVADVRDDVFHP